MSGSDSIKEDSKFIFSTRENFKGYLQSQLLKINREDKKKEKI